ncbi:MAG TPA: TonB-dependent receptor plug domain-containing protein, partial [Gemmatimonadales bacterium]|nr:TonB-dependent receptor plug domain-containing protein [Gemmatimonadales bacterium]
MIGIALLAAPGPGAAAAQGQDPASRLVRGRVLAAAGGAAVADVVIAVASGLGGHALSSPSGRFAVRVAGGEVRLVAARMGFAPETLAVAPGRDTVTILLRAAAVALDPILVAVEPGFSAASARAIRDLDIRLRPRETAQELLRLAPGLVIAQHAGGGKAEQIFLRGFDADHGTDVAVSVDGVPVNMVSHAHGQGYADLHFLIPEVVERGEVRKGPYDPRDGNLATAGAVDFRTRDRLEGGNAEVRAGSFGTAHLTALAPFGGPAGRPGGYLAASAHTTDGPVVRAQEYRRLNGFARLTAPVGREAELVATGS